MDTATRRTRYSKVSTTLAHLDDDALRNLLGDQPTRSAWSVHQIVEVAGERVFVKHLPLTDLEHARKFSTSNHYRLPLYYQYGVGSAGFGTWRELVTHVKTTNWVLEDAIATFPLTYHVRVLSRPARSDPPADPARLDEYVRDWNSSRNIARYITERTAGTHVAVIFVEHVPHSIWEWLSKTPEDIDRLLRQLCDTIAFLRGHGIIHFDAHFGNIMTDGERVYLTDFGLVLDRRFDLTAREREFLDRHPHYDYGGVVGSVGPQLGWWYMSLPEVEQEAVRTLLGAQSDRPEIRLLVRDVERLTGLLHPALVAATVRNRDVILFMVDFLTRLKANRRKNTPFDDAKLRDLLQAAGVVSEAERSTPSQP